MMQHTISIDNLIFMCNIQSYYTSPAQPSYNADSDWEAIGYTDFDYSVYAVHELDEEDNPHLLSAEESQRILYGVGNIRDIVERKLIQSMFDDEDCLESKYD